MRTIYFVSLYSNRPLVALFMKTKLTFKYGILVWHTSLFVTKESDAFSLFPISIIFIHIYRQIVIMCRFGRTKKIYWLFVTALKSFRFITTHIHKRHLRSKMIEDMGTLLFPLSFSCNCQTHTTTYNVCVFLFCSGKMHETFHSPETDKICKRN